jgi:hypothetical protein
MGILNLLVVAARLYPNTLTSTPVAASMMNPDTKFSIKNSNTIVLQ